MSKYCLTTVKTHRENSRASKGSSQGFPQVKQGEQESVNWPSWCHIWDHLVGNLNAQPRIVTSTSFHIISSAVTPSEQQIFPARVSFAGELIREFTWKAFPEPLDHGARASFPHLPAAALLLLLIRDIGIISCLPPASFWLQMRFVLPRIKKKTTQKQLLLMNLLETLPALFCAPHSNQICQWGNRRCPPGCLILVLERFSILFKGCRWGWWALTRSWSFWCAEREKGWAKNLISGAPGTKENNV